MKLFTMFVTLLFLLTTIECKSTSRRPQHDQTEILEPGEKTISAVSLSLAELTPKTLQAISSKKRSFLIANQDNLPEIYTKLPNFSIKIIEDTEFNSLANEEENFILISSHTGESNLGLTGYHVNGIDSIDSFVNDFVKKSISKALLTRTSKKIDLPELTRFHSEVQPAKYPQDQIEHLGDRPTGKSPENFDSPFSKSLADNPLSSVSSPQALEEILASPATASSTVFDFHDTDAVPLDKSPDKFSFPESEKFPPPPQIVIKVEETPLLEVATDLASFKRVHLETLSTDILLKHSNQPLQFECPIAEIDQLKEAIDEKYGSAFTITAVSSTSLDKLIVTIKSRYSAQDLKVLRENAAKLRLADLSDVDFTFHLAEVINIHYGRPYSDPKHPTGGFEKSLEKDGVTVYRGNHPLDHGVRQGKLAVDIVDIIVRDHQKVAEPIAVFIQEYGKDPLFRRKVQFTSSFQRTGRESEIGYPDDPVGAKRYGRTDVEFFKQAAQASGLFSPEEIKLYAAGLNDAAQAMGKNHPLGAILFAAHSLDLLRMRPIQFTREYSSSGVKGKVLSALYPPGTPSTEVDATIEILAKRTESYLEANGVIGYGKFKDQWFHQNNDRRSMAKTIHELPSLETIKPPPAAQLDGTLFPTSPQEVFIATGSAVGGSTGAMKVEMQGRTFIKKVGGIAGSAHLKNEFMAINALKTLGVPVPEARLYISDDGSQVAMLTTFIESGRKSIVPTGEDAETIKKKIRKYFVANVLVGNDDVVGFHFDNIIFDKSDNPVFVDVGSSFFYTATGKIKPAKFFPDDVSQDIAKMQRTDTQWTEINNAGRIFQGIDSKEILQQIDDCLAREKIFMDQILGDALKLKMTERFNSLREYKAKLEQLSPS